MNVRVAVAAAVFFGPFSQGKIVIAKICVVFVTVNATQLRPLPRPFSQLLFKRLLKI